MTLALLVKNTLRASLSLRFSMLNLFLLVVLLIVFPINTFAAEQLVKHEKKLPIDIALFEYPPLFHTAKNGQISGLIAETLKELCVVSNLECRFHMRPVARAYAELEAERFKALVTVKFDKFKECCVASQWHYPWRSGIYSKKPLASIPTKLENMKDGLIIIRGWHSPYQYFNDLVHAEKNSTLTIHRANTSKASLMMLQRGRAPYLWCGGEFHWYIKNMDIDPLNFKPLLELPMVLWISKTETEIINRINKGFKKIHHLLDINNQLIDDIMLERYMD